METRPFGKLPDGTTAHLYTLTNDRGIKVAITDYGGIIVSLHTPDRNGQSGDIVLGFDNLEAYLKGHPYFGAIIGRYGNRIARGRFILDGKEYKLATNNGPNHLHGGLKGFDKVLWQARPFQGSDRAGLVLYYLSADGEEGYPGNLAVTVTYTLFDQTNEFRIDYRAFTDKPTILNLTNHTYFNLATRGNVLNQLLQLNARYYTPVDETLIPTGEIAPVEGTPFDFTQPVAIGARINSDHPQMKIGRGYDHNFVLDKPAGELGLVAKVYDPASGRILEVWSTEPGVQFYTGNYLDGSLTGKGGIRYERHAGFCLETQHFPDSPNKPHFPSVVLRPGQLFESTTIWKFFVGDGL